MIDTGIPIVEAPATVVSSQANGPVGPPPAAQLPQIVYLSALAAAAPSGGLRQQILGGLITLAGAAITTYGIYMANKVADTQAAVVDVSEAVAEVHTLANSNLAAVNDRLDEALAQIAEQNRLILLLTANAPADPPPPSPQP